MRTVIAGCGIAGYTCAVTLHELAPEEEIMLFDAGERGLYSRIRLPEVLAGTLPEEKLVLAPPALLAEKGIRFFPGRTVDSLDPARKTFTCGERTEKYDRFVIAAGAEASIPPVPGLECGMTLRKIEDVEKILDLAGKTDSGIVVGGGLLGLEAASALRARGLKVTVIECLDRLLPGVLKEKESAVLAEMLAEKGIRTVAGAKISGVAREENCFRVTLSGGCVFEGGVLLVSAGIRPETGLAKRGGLAVKRGIVVDSRFECSMPDCFAIGDCAETGGRVYGLWMASKDQGAALGSILAGKLDSYVPPVFSPVPKIPGIPLKLLRERAGAAV